MVTRQLVANPAVFFRRIVGLPLDLQPANHASHDHGDKKGSNFPFASFIGDDSPVSRAARWHVELFGIPHFRYVNLLNARFGAGRANK